MMMMMRSPWRTSRPWWPPRTRGPPWAPRPSARRPRARCLSCAAAVPRAGSGEPWLVERRSRDHAAHLSLVAAPPPSLSSPPPTATSCSHPPTAWRTRWPTGEIETAIKIFAVYVKKYFREAKFSCQKQRSILLEFDTRAEVDDFQRLVADEHISPPEGGEVWIGRGDILDKIVTENCDMWPWPCPGVKRSAGGSFLYQYNSINATSMLGLLPPDVDYHQCASFKWASTRYRIYYLYLPIRPVSDVWRAHNSSYSLSLIVN